MENTVILKDTFTEKYQYLKSLPLALAKYKAHHNCNYKQGYKEYIHESDDHITSAYTNITIGFAPTSMFCRLGNSIGLSYNKKTKKLNLWGKGRLSEKMDYFMSLLKYLNIDWVEKMRTYPNYSHIILSDILTKTLGEQIINGKVTNPEELIKAYIRISYKRKDIPWTLVRKYLNDFKHRSHKFPAYNITLNNIFLYTTNPTSALAKILSSTLSDDYCSLLNDTFEQCFILNEKLNIDWSLNRLIEEHERMTNAITDLDIASKDAKPIEYVGDAPLLDGMTLIQSEVDAFREANYMHNCIYTNYWNSIKNKYYFVVRYIKDGIHYDIGIYSKYKDPNIFRWGANNQDRETARIDQMKALRNANVPQEIADEVNQWFAQDEVKQFFDNQLPDRVQHVIDGQTEEVDEFALPF